MQVHGLRSASSPGLSMSMKRSESRSLRSAWPTCSGSYSELEEPRRHDSSQLLKQSEVLVVLSKAHCLSLCPSVGQSS